MLTVTLSDEQWQKILPFLRSHPNAYVGREQDCRQFLEVVLWITRSGAQWRLLPAEYGDWNTVYKQFSRWSRQGVFEQLHQLFVGDADMEHLMIDSTIIRAHPCAAGASKKSVGQEAQALGRSRGGFSAKIHIAVDAVGNPLRLLLTAGQRHDSPQAGAMIEGYEPQALIAAKGYDSDLLIESVTSKGIEAVIPPKKNRLV
jgi:transposase